MLTQNENIHRVLNISIQQQPKNIQHTTATRSRTSAFSATASPAPKSTKRPTTHNIQKSEQKQPTTPCIFCSGMPWTTQCHKYSTPQQRRELAKSKKLCFKCLKTGHKIYDCSRKFFCYYCKGNHHLSLCLTPKRSHPPIFKRQTATPAVVEQFEPSDNDNQLVSLFTSAVTKVLSSNRHITQSVPLLPCQRIKIFNPQKPTLRTQALVFFDRGSQISFISYNLQSQLSLLPQQSAPITLNGIAGTKSKRNCTAVQFGLELKDKSTHLIKAFTLSPLTGSFLHAELTKEELAILSDNPCQELPVPLYNTQPTVLIGLNSTG